jgi:hypothetical protein
LLSIDAVQSKIRGLEAKFSERDGRHGRVRDVRGGRIAGVFPQYFSAEESMPLVSNFIDVVARDLSEAIAPLPALNCSSGMATSDRARAFAAKKQRVGAYYWLASNLELQMFPAADQYLTYGLTAFIVEPDLENQMPRIRMIDAVGAYPEMNLNGDCVSFTRRWMTKTSTLAAQYPHLAPKLMQSDQFGRVMDVDVRCYAYYDDSQVLVFVPERGNLVLEKFQNHLGECPVVVAVRPSPDGEMRGQFDDILGVQAARAVMMRLAVEAAEKQVQAPLAVPDDVTEINLGPDAIMRSQNPEKIHRVDLSVGQATFAEAASLEQELLMGSRYPQGRQGNINASVVTGRGVEALMGGFDTQIKTAQVVFAHALRKATSLCFKLDETYWRDTRRTIRGVVEGTPFEQDYTPSKDIAGDYTCDVTYGFLAGMDPNRALVFMLQALSAKLLDRATVQRHMPFDIDVTQLQQNIDVEEMRDALKQGVLAYVQAIGPIAEQGGDPSLILQVLAETVQGRQKGKALEVLLADAFTTLQQRQQAQQQAAAEAAQQAGGGAGGPGGQLPPGVQDSGLLQGVSPGQAGMAPGGRPTLQTLMASVGSNGQADLRAGVRRNLPG